MSWIPMYSGVVNSSLWDLDDGVIKVFLTILAEKGPRDIYTGTNYALARSARKTEEEVVAALKVLSGPDTLRKEEQSHGGARIARVEGGWHVINAAFYRKKMSEELKRYRNAKAQKVWREKQAALRNGTRPLPGEAAYRTAETPEEEDRVVTTHLPEPVPELGPPEEEEQPPYEQEPVE